MQWSHYKPQVYIGMQGYFLMGRFPNCNLILSGFHCTEPRKSLGTWLREISSYSCLTFLSGPAWVLLSKICKDLFSALYYNSYRQINISQPSFTLCKCYANAPYVLSLFLRFPICSTRVRFFDSSLSEAILLE